MDETGRHRENFHGMHEEETEKRQQHARVAHISEEGVRPDSIFFIPVLIRGQRFELKGLTVVASFSA